MPPTITEDTLPAEADTGIRRITYECGAERLILQFRQEIRPEDCPGEIHPATQPFQPSPQVPTNQLLINACLTIARQALATPRLQTL